MEIFAILAAIQWLGQILFDHARYEVVQTRAAVVTTYKGHSDNYGGNLGLNFLIGDNFEIKW